MEPAPDAAARGGGATSMAEDAGAPPPAATSSSQAYQKAEPQEEEGGNQAQAQQQVQEQPQPQPLAQQPPAAMPMPAAGLSRYESQKRRDWNTFLQYLLNHKPPLTLPRCSGAHVIEFLKYLDQFGKTKVHADGCAYFGQPNPPAPCACPLRQAWGSLDALIGRLRAAYEESGGRPESNPFAARAVRIYLREVREAQAKARGIPYEKKKRKRGATGGGGAAPPVVITADGAAGAGTSGVGGGGAAEEDDDEATQSGETATTPVASPTTPASTTPAATVTATVTAAKGASAATGSAPSS